MEILTSEAQVEDFEFINRLSNQLGYKARTDKTKERLSEILASADHCVFVAIDHEIVVGWIHGFYTLRIESDSFVEIGGLVTDENYRRKGIGKMLVESMAEWAKHKKVSTIRVRCNIVRKDSHWFYSYIGFEELKEQKVFTYALQ